MILIKIIVYLLLSVFLSFLLCLVIFIKTKSDFVYHNVTIGNVSFEQEINGCSHNLLELESHSIQVCVFANTAYARICNIGLWTSCILIEDAELKIVCTHFFEYSVSAITGPLLNGPDS